METDDKISALDNKKKRIRKEYVNDFRTGKTTVLEKPLHKSINSYFDNQTPEILSNITPEAIAYRGSPPHIPCNDTKIEQSRHATENETTKRNQYRQGDIYEICEHKIVTEELKEAERQDVKDLGQAGAELTSTDDEVMSTRSNGSDVIPNEEVTKCGDNDDTDPVTMTITNTTNGRLTDNGTVRKEETHSNTSKNNSKVSVCDGEANKELKPETSSGDGNVGVSINSTLNTSYKNVDESAVCLEYNSTNYIDQMSDSSKVELLRENSEGDTHTNEESVLREDNSSQNAYNKTEIENATVGGLDKIHDTESINSDVVLPETTENNDRSHTDNTLTEISSGTIPPINELETREDGYHEKLKPEQMIIIASENDVGDTPILSKQDILPNCLINKELKDCSTQTDFACTSIEAMYSILCEKCGHKVDMKEILLNLLNYPLMLNNGHICTELEEELLVNSNIDGLQAEENNFPMDEGFGFGCLNPTTSAEIFDSLSNQAIAMDMPVLNQNLEDPSYCHLSKSRHANEDKQSLRKTPNVTQQSEDQYAWNYASEPNLYDSTDLPDHTPTSGLTFYTTDDLRGELNTHMSDPFQQGQYAQHYAQEYTQQYDQQYVQQHSQQHVQHSQHVQQHSQQHAQQHAQHMQQYAQQHEQQYAHARDEFEQAVEGFQDEYDSLTYMENAADNFHPNDVDTKVQKDDSSVDKDSKMLPPRNVHPQDKYTGGHVMTGSFSSTSPGTKTRCSHHHTWNSGKRTTNSKLKNKNSYRYRGGDMMDKLTTFAEDNALDVHNVSADGNCMFSAVVDQLWINGNFHFTTDSLRKQAVEFLRRVPTHKDGTHLDSFLATESWDEYLHRMDRNGEWGDHMVLQGVAEVIICRIIVISSDIVKTELIPWHAKCDMKKLDIVLLGHMGEYHYVSLRPLNWMCSWAIKAKMRLLDELHGTSYQGPSDVDISASSDTSEALVSTDKERNTDEDIEEVQNNQYGNRERETEEITVDVKTPPLSTSGELDLSYIAISNSGLIEEAMNSKVTIELFDSQEDLTRIIDDVDYIDKFSSVPVRHLTFYIRHLLEPEDIHVHPYSRNMKYNIGKHLPVKCVIYGSVGEDLVVSPYTCFSGMLYPQILFYIPEIADIVYHTEPTPKPHSLLVDTNACQPGFLRLQVIDQQYFKDCTLVRIDDKVYLELLRFNSSLKNNNQWIELQVKQGLQCPNWPQALTSQFKTRERPSGWPDSETLSEFCSRPCHIRKNNHYSSKHVTAEWQFIYPFIENDLIMYRMDKHMKYVLQYFKMLIECHTSSCPKMLRSNHIKTIMLFCCESLPTSVWSNNMGGAILFLVSKFMQYLYQRYIPHYIMNDVNLLDTYKEHEIDALLRDLEHIRLFPLMAFNVFAENNNLLNQWIIHSVVNDIQRFRADRDHLKSLEQTFCPTLIEVAKRLVMMGTYNFYKGYKMLQRAYKMTSQFEEERQVENPQSFEQFVEPFAYSVDDPIVRYFFTNFVDRELHIDILNKMIISDHVRIVGDIVEKVDGGDFNRFPIPDGSKLDDVEYLDNFAQYLMTINELENAAHFFRCGIALGKEGLSSETIDVSEINDDEIKTQIANKNIKTVKNFNQVLYNLYNRLIQCYTEMKHKEFFQEFIHDYEDLVLGFDNACYYSKLASTWADLGNEDKYDYYENKSEEYRQNSQNTRV